MILTVLALASAQAIDCADPIGTTQINECADRRFQRVDAAMNAQWAITVASVREIGADALKLLRNAQHSWIRYRDEHCLAEGRIAENGAHPELVMADCKAELTAMRIKQLKSLAEDR